VPIKVQLMYGFNFTGPQRPGFSEVHYYLASPSSTLDAGLNLAVQQLMNARTQMMGNNVIAAGYRLSVPGVPRRSNTVYAAPTPSGPGPLAFSPAISQGTSDIPNTSVLIPLKSSAQQTTRSFLAGLPDAFIFTGNPVGPDWGAAGLNNYQALWNTFINILLNGNWGWNALNTLPAGQPQAISFWQQSASAPFNCQIVIPNNAPYLPTVGSIVHVRKTLMGVTGVPRPIGRWRIKLSGAVDTNNNFYELDQSSSFQAVLVQQPGTVESVSYGYVAYATAGGLLQTSRRRGIGPVRPRGRSRRPLRRQAF
jgi:hypothetical protein